MMSIQSFFKPRFLYYSLIYILIYIVIMILFIDLYFNIYCYYNIFSDI